MRKLRPSQTVALSLLLLTRPALSFEGSRVHWRGPAATSSLSPDSAVVLPPRSTLATRTSVRRTSVDGAQRRQPECLGPCENPFDEVDIDADRREALFALAGSLWAVGMLPAPPAFATPGTDANIRLPNPLEQIADRATKQCLVESLGNRECLVYMDDANKLYQGTDSRVLLSRVESSAQALATVPSYIESKKWSQVLGVLTGPMGELVRTMGQLAGASADSAAAKKKIAAFKTDLYALAAAVDKRNGAQALASHAAVTAALVEFVKGL
jgi:hypothetical protein